MPTTSRSAGGPRSEKSRNRHQARDRRTRRQELRKRHLRQDWREQPSRTRSLVRGPNTRRAGYSCDFEIPLGNCARNQRTRETVCNRPRTSLSKECLLSASPRWTITAFEWESPGRRYPRLARSKGVAKCLNWREILLALPDWDCFSAPSTNRDLLDSFFFLSQHFVDCLAQLASCGERNSLIQDCYAFPSSTRHSSLRERMRRGESVKSPDPDPPHFARRLDPVKHGFHTSPARTSVRGYR